MKKSYQTKAARSAEQKSSSAKDSPVSDRRGIFTFRMLLCCILALVLVVSLPLFTVWKQVYITNTALRNKQIADSLSVLNKESVRLRLECQRLSRTERIEQIAREKLALRYPSSREIVIVRPKKEKKNSFSLPRWRILAVIRKSLSQENG